MSRETDKYLELKERAELANDYRPDAFVSIHLNSADIESAHGTETYCHPDKLMYKPLAMEIQNHAIAQTGSRDRGVKTSNLAVLRETNMPAALFESGFITNPNESANLADPSYQDKLANGIANGIEKYLKENVKLDTEKPETPETPEKPEQAVVKNTGVVTATNLNVRSGYGANYSKIGMLKNGDKVKVSVRFRGREMGHTQLGEEVLNEFVELTSEYGVVDKKPKMEGRRMVMFLVQKTED